MLKTAMELINSSLYDGRVPVQRNVDHLLTVRYSAMQALDHGQRRLVNAGRLMALVRADRVDTALKLASDMEESWPDPLDRELPIQTILAFDAALTEVYIAAGDSLHAMGWAVKTAQHIEECDDPRWQYRASGLMASSYVINGQWEKTENQVAFGNRLLHKQGWDVDRADYMHAVAETFLCFITLDTERLERLLARLRKLEITEPTAQSLGDLAEALLWTFLDDRAAAMEVTQRIQQGVMQPHGPGLVRSFAQQVQVLQTLQDWDSLRAINALQQQESVGNHVMCPNVLLGIARMQMGDYAGVLAETSECVKIRDTHSLWSFPAITLSRAIAHMKLGNNNQALRNLMMVYARARGKYFAGALWLLPREDLLELLDFAQQKIPFAKSEIEPFRKAVLTFSRGEGTELPAIQSLSERERIIAHYLRGDLSLKEIARELYVSPGTVTAQASAIYRKLGVRKRKEAVLCLERIGFYESEPRGGGGGGRISFRPF